MEYRLGKIDNSYNFKRHCLEKQLSEIQVLVLGSSQVTYGVDPGYFCMKGFNLSNFSQSLYYDSKLTLKYLDRMPKLKCVMISISCFSFGFDLIDSPEPWRDYYYSQFWQVDFPELGLFEVKRYSKLFLYSPRASLSYMRHGFTIDLLGSFKQNGYLFVNNTNTSEAISDSSGHKRVQYHNKFASEKRFAENQKNVSMLVAELTRRGIRAVIVTPPVLPTYSKFIDPAWQKRNCDSISSICKRYRCTYFNYFTDQRFIQKDFYDNDHLNYIGAEKFSKILSADILMCQP